MVNAAAINNIIDQAFAESAIITGQTLLSTIAPASDLLLVYDASATALKKVAVETLGVGTVTSVNFNATPGSIFDDSVATQTTTPVISLSLANQTAGKVLAGPVSGSATTPSFRVLSPSDLPVATVTVAANLIDWSLGNCFKKSLTATVGLTFSNPSEGQEIRLLISNTGAFNATFPTGVNGVYWAGDTVYAATQGAGRHDIIIFRYIGSNYYGNYLLDFRST